MNTFVHIVGKLGTQLTHASNQRVEGREGITYYIIILFFYVLMHFVVIIIVNEFLQ